MKTISETTNKSKANGSKQQAQVANSPDTCPGNGNCTREQRIAEAAYYRAEQRGFAPGNEMSDWFEAETDVENLLESRP